MQSVIGSPNAPVKDPASEGSWIQITFTLDTGRYRMLRDRAETARLTVPGFVRESVMGSLNESRLVSRTEEFNFQ